MGNDLAGTNTSRPLAVKVLVVLEVVFGALGIISGVLLMADPSGALVGFPSSVAERIPFQNFFLVGLFLFVIYGLYPLILAYGAWTRKEMFFREIGRAGGIHWSWQGVAALLVILAVWLFVEGLLIGLDYPATYMTIALGLGLLIALVMPSTRSNFRVGNGGAR
jgi:hypothetical protein